MGFNLNADFGIFLQPGGGTQEEEEEEKSRSELTKAPTKKVQSAAILSIFIF